MKNKYVEMIKKHQEEFNEFPMFFAFNDKQFEEGMQKLGLTKDDGEKVTSFSFGGIYRKSDRQKLDEMLSRHAKERETNIANDKTGKGFIYQMFYCELSNHEYSYTMDLSETLDILGYSIDDINNDERLLAGLSKASNELLKGCY